MIQYRQSPPALWLGEKLFTAGIYSGHGEGLNNPALESTRCVGPIPKGLYEIRLWLDKHPAKGPCVAVLRPLGHDAHGRSGFMIHGDSAALNHSASLGCIIAPHDVREKLRASGATQLLVI